MKISLTGIKKEIFTIFFTLIFIVGLPTSLLLFLPIYLLRFTVSLLKRLFRPDLNKMIVTHSAVLAMDSPYKNPQWNLCVWIVVDHNIETSVIQEMLLDPIFLKKLPSGEWADPEYQQYYYKWLGFLFWKWEENFDKDFHIRNYFPDSIINNQVTTEDDLTKILKKQSFAPFKEGTSPWEVLVINNYKPNPDYKDLAVPFPQTVVIFRTHHALCDGFSILNALTRTLENDKSGEKEIVPSVYYPKNLLKLALSPLLAPYQLMKMFVHASDQNEWHNFKGELTGESCRMSFTPRVPTSLIKEVKSSLGVSYTSVVMSVIAGGVRKTMLRQGLRLPRNLNVAVPCPLPSKRPTKLRNHWVFAFMKLPIAMADPLERLRKTEENLLGLKDSFIPFMTHSLIPLVGGLFPWMMKVFNNNTFSTLLVSNFPGPTSAELGFYTTGDGCRHEVTDMNFGGGMGSGNVGVGISMLSYSNGVRIVTEMDSSILPDDESVKLFNQDIVNELYALLDLGKV